jgi:integrase
MVLLGCWGGLRFGEQVGLRVRCVNPLHGTVLVERAVVEVGGHQLEGLPKTAAGRRTVPLPRLVVDELLPYLAGKEPDELVFTAPEGGMMRRTIWAARFWRPAVRAAGLEPLRVHDMRHTAVALWIAGGASPLETTRRTGHGSSARVLDIYGRSGRGEDKGWQ